MPAGENNIIFIAGSVRNSSQFEEIDVSETRIGQAPAATAPSFIEIQATRLPGILLCLAITLVAMVIQHLEEGLFGHPFIEALVIAILLGIAVRSLWAIPARFHPGISFSTKQVLEFAVMLFGASISLGAIVASGPLLLSAIVATVVATLAASYLISKGLGLTTKMAILVACGNSICGNSAIAAVAPVIGASNDDIASSISFTAVLGVVMVLSLPLLVPLLSLSEYKYGVLAGMTVYAVPQVLAATVPVGLISTQVGTLVKLMRVLMLGPVVVGFGLFAHRLRGEDHAEKKPFSIWAFVPWFILGFLAFAALRSLGLIPDIAVMPIAKFANFLTVIAMAALGLGVDIRVLGKVGGKVTSAVVLSLVVLLLLSLAVIAILPASSGL